MSDRIDWPAGFDRKGPSERTRNRKFDVTLAQAFDDPSFVLRRMMDGEQDA